MSTPSTPKLLINITVLPKGRAPVFTVRTIPYDDLQNVLSTISTMLYTAPLDQYVPINTDNENE